MIFYLKSYLLLVISSVLILLGGTLLLFPHTLQSIFADLNSVLKKDEQLTVSYSIEEKSDIESAFPVDLLGRYVFQQEGKDVFSLQLARYRDDGGQRQDALLFPKDRQESTVLPSPTAQRQEIWQATAKTISVKAPKDAVLLSWWDDGQRVQFLSGHKTWLNKPAEATFMSPLWAKMQNNMLLASDVERDHLVKMARWLTMDSEKALVEIRQYFGTDKPVYLIVNNDLLMRLGEMADYEGTPLLFNSITVPVSDNLHGDIAKIKAWAYEQGDGNYLVQKEGLYYRVWVVPRQVGAEKNALLIHLLPFVDSLKKLPESVHLVYQSKWGGYLSIYQITK